MPKTHRRHPLARVTLANLASHKLRLLLTIVSVVLGTSFISASLVFTATLQGSFQEMFNSSLSSIDLRVSSSNQIGSIPLTERTKIADVKGVAGTNPVVVGGLAITDQDGKAQIAQPGGVTAVGHFQNTGNLTKDIRLATGHFPQAYDEIALSQPLAKAMGYHLGDTVEWMSAAGGIEKGTLVGTLAPTDTDQAQLLFTPDHLMKSFTDGENVNAIDVDVDTSQPGITVQKVRAELHKMYPKYKVQTGQEVADEMNKEVRKNLTFFNYFLVAFGVIALVVGTFLIYNTFAMIVAQRIRELALLRAIGATRRQVTLSVLAEALVVGLLGAALGVAAGAGLAFGLAALMSKVGMAISNGGLTVTATSIIVPLVLGVLVTLVSAWVPARRAGNIPPVQAMHQDSNTAMGSLKGRTIAGVVFLVAGIVVAAVAGASMVGKPGFITVGVGALAMMLGLFLAGPALSKPAVYALGSLIKPLPPFRQTGTLAMRNALRNPVRTATTAFALTLGLILVSIVGVMGSSTTASTKQVITGGLTCDFVIVPPTNMMIPRQFTPGVEDMVGVEDSSAIFYGFTDIDGDPRMFASPDRDASRMINYEIAEGRYDMSGDALLISQKFAEKRQVHAGDTMTVETRTGDQKVPVKAIFKDNPVIGDVVMSFPLYEKVVPPSHQLAYLILVQSNGMYGASTMKAQLQNSLAKLKILRVQTTEEFAGRQAKLLDSMLSGLYALLMLSIIIAVLGVVNTLALSVTERRQEIGMLRAIGMSRASLRQMFYLESIVLSVFGTVLGTAAGTLLGWALTNTMSNYGISIVVIPWQMIVGVLVGSVVVGVLAALGPAKRAAKISPLRAIAD